MTVPDRPPDPGAGHDVPWRRLDRRMIVVDAIQAAASLALAVAAAGALGGDAGGGMALAVAAGVGVVGALSDAYRWAVTRYRVTADLVELRTGLFVRRERAVRRDRIRSVDVHAKLRHRLCGLRLVKIGAGQQASTGEAAFDLDAVSIADALALQALLLRRRPGAHVEDPRPGAATVDDPDGPAEPGAAPDREVLARFRPGWVVYNVFNVFAYVMAAGLLWGAWWLLPVVGVEPADLVERVVDWDRLGTAWSIALVAAVVTVLGVVGMGVNFFLEHWGFELARVPTDDGGTALRTRQGLLTTREVSRDDRRLRGVQISEPLPWRWMGMADTAVVTTGLSVDLWATGQPTAILPRGPIGTARPVAAAVLGTATSPLDVPLVPHPAAALHRRLWWATGTAAAAVVALGSLALAGTISPGVAVASIALWPVTLGAAVIAHRALGHAIDGEHLIVRSGLSSRATTALQRSAVSTIAVRESVLQRRLGLRTVVAMTSAGYGAYEAPDLAAGDALRFAAAATPGLLDPFLASDDSDDSDDGRRDGHPTGGTSKAAAGSP